MDLNFPAAILFDWDSTLVDNWDSVLAAWNKALVHHGHAPMRREDAIRRAGIPPQENFLAVFGEDFESGRSMFYEELLSPRSLERLKCLQGVEELLIAFKALDIPMAIVSNKQGSILKREIEHLKWQDYFQASVGAGDAAYDKPHPAPLLYAAELMGIPVSPSVWMVGDMASDMQAAIAAGMAPVFIETTASLELGLEGDLHTHKPVSRVRDAGALRTLVEGLARPI
jgi:phosphoglycolate phosphatase